MIYVIVLLQTTLYISNTATKAVVDEFTVASPPNARGPIMYGGNSSGSSGSRLNATNQSMEGLSSTVNAVSTVGAPDEEAKAAAFVVAVYNAINVFQLDFTSTVQLTCLDAPPLLAEKAYTAVMLLVLVAW